MIAAGERAGSAEQASRRLIIVGVDDSAEAEAAAQWAVREAELRKDDVLLVHAGPQRGQALLDKIAGTLPVPPTMHLDQLVAIDSPESLLSRLSEQAELTVLGHDHPALGGHMPFGHTTRTVASLSRQPVVAVPRGWSPRADDRRPVAVAVDGQHPSSSTLGYAFTEASLHQVPVLVVHSAPLAELVPDEQDTRLNLAEILAGWKADYPDIDVETKCLPVRPATRCPRCRPTYSCWSSAPRAAVGSGPAGSARSRVPYLIAPLVRLRSFRSSVGAPRPPTSVQPA
jgi:nucleotide-binding universal stress UspA family protein